jgi:4-amino-4-deoxy-L-arabinose transferase-like glycosyltransferase
VLLTFFIGKKLYTPRTGFLSALILATSFEFAYLSTRANIDATLTFFTTTSIFFFLHWYPQSKVEGDDEKDKTSVSIYGFYISMAFATLAKGPVGFILPLMLSLVYLLVQKDWMAIRKMRLLTGVILVLVVVLSWYLPAVLKGGREFLNQTLFHQTLERFAKGTSHIRPLYYYLANFPLDFLPWFLFLPGALVYGFSERKKGISRGFLFLLVWLIVIFLFFSLSKGKRAIYLLPLYPAASLLVGRFWNDYLSGPGPSAIRKIWVTLPIYLFIIIFFFIGIFLCAAPAVTHFSVEPSTPKMLKMIVKGTGLGAQYLSYVPRWSVIPFIVLLVGSGVLLFLGQRLRHKSLVFILLVATVGVGFCYMTRVIFPLVNLHKSARLISQEIVQTMKANGKLAIYGDSGSAVTSQFNFYTGIVPILEIENEGEIINLFHSTERVFCLAEYDDYEILVRKHPDLSLNRITRRSVGNRDMVFLSNR